MGQQQLLLLVLGIVIVGIAVVAGIQAFSEGKAKAEQDAAVSDAMRIITDIQAWKLKPAAFGGGESKTFDEVTFNALGVSTTGDGADSDNAKYETLNGCYDLAGTTHTLDVYETDCATAIAGVDITGASPDSISWTYK